MPAKSEKQRRYMGMMLAKKRAGKKVKIPTKVLRDFARKGKR